MECDRPAWCEMTALGAFEGEYAVPRQPLRGIPKNFFAAGRLRLKPAACLRL